MRPLLVVCVLFLGATLPASAHPGVGIVMDPSGNVFYTDLVHVWMIATDGSKSIAVRDVHSHELAIDSAGNLFGEDSEYLGGDRYRHRVWRRSLDGRVSDVIPWRDGFWREYGFVRGPAGTMYWVQCPERMCVIRKRTSDGRTSTVTPSVPFSQPINWFAASPDGSLVVVEGSSLRRIGRDGRSSMLARGLGSQLMGLWVDARNNVYVAVYGNRKVVRVSPEGRVTTVASTPEPWGPSGVLRAPNGDLWILEYSTTNAVRVRRVAVDGDTTVF